MKTWMYFFFLLPACLQHTNGVQPVADKPAFLLNDSTVAGRFPPPPGFIRPPADARSFAFYLRHFPLKPAETPVYLHNGALKSWQDVHAAVLDIDTGPENLQQCADAVMRLRAEYLFHEKRYEDIHFNFTNGFNATYDRWRQGERIRVIGNQAKWVPGAGADTGYASFRKYLKMVFTYAGTASLEKELSPVPLEDVMPGDIFIQGGFPGHAVLVMDTGVDTLTGARVMLLAQSYMPAQDIHVLRNLQDTTLNPWYAVSAIEEQLETPEWVFRREDLRRFKD